jgi:hypothetical protein
VRLVEERRGELWAARADGTCEIVGRTGGPVGALSASCNATGGCGTSVGRIARGEGSDSVGREVTCQPEAVASPPLAGP